MHRRSAQLAVESAEGLTNVQWFTEFEKILKAYQWDLRILYIDEQTDAGCEVKNRPIQPSVACLAARDHKRVPGAIISHEFAHRV
jgi:hypothetical protein